MDNFELDEQLLYWAIREIIFIHCYGLFVAILINLQKEDS